MKERSFVIAVLIICISIWGYSTTAYFTSEDTARNVITTGSLDIRIEEWQQTEGGLVPYPEDKEIIVMPATKVSKIVTVKNLGAQGFVRAKLDITVKDELENVMEVVPEELNRVITLTMNDQDWVQKDGWWYYILPVKSYEATEPLMTEVVFDGPNMTNEFQGCTVEIKVIAHAVQQANNGETALDAAGWPE